MLFLKEKNGKKERKERCRIIGHWFRRNGHKKGLFVETMFLPPLSTQEKVPKTRVNESFLFSLVSRPSLRPGAGGVSQVEPDSRLTSHTFTPPNPSFFLRAPLEETAASHTKLFTDAPLPRECSLHPSGCTCPDRTASKCARVGPRFA